MISPSQRVEFDVIVNQAKLEGWLDRAARMTATALGASVLIECKAGDSAWNKCYPDDERWPYMLLRDLAHGAWRTSPNR